MMEPLDALLVVIGFVAGVGSLPDTFKITALLVNPSAWLWWGAGQVLVKLW